MRRLPLIAAALALLIGLSWPHARKPPETDPPIPGLPGFTLVAEYDLAPKGRHRMVVLRNPASCTVVMASLDIPEEVLPLLRKALNRDAFDDWQLLLDGQAAPGGSVFMVNLRRFWTRLRSFHQPVAQFLADPEHCRPH